KDARQAQANGLSGPPCQNEAKSLTGRASFDARQHVAAGVLPVAEERLRRQFAARDELAVDVEDPARMDVVEQKVPALPALRHANAMRHVAEAYVVRMSSVDAIEVEIQVVAAVGEPRQDFARVARKQMHASGKLALEVVHAFDSVDVG